MNAILPKIAANFKLQAPAEIYCYELATVLLKYGVYSQYRKQENFHASIYQRKALAFSIDT